MTRDGAFFCCSVQSKTINCNCSVYPLTGGVQRGNASDFSPRKAKNKWKSVFDGALPRQKHFKPSRARPCAVVKRNSLHSASALGRKLHIRSFRFPLKIKASALILEGRRREQSAVFVTLDGNGAPRASSDAEARPPCASCDERKFPPNYSVPFQGD